MLKLNAKHSGLRVKPHGRRLRRKKSLLSVKRPPFAGYLPRAIPPLSHVTFPSRYVPARNSNRM